jgi:hypothetical protein
LYTVTPITVTTKELTLHSLKDMIIIHSNCVSLSKPGSIDSYYFFLQCNYCVQVKGNKERQKKDQRMHNKHRRIMRQKLWLDFVRSWESFNETHTHTWEMFKTFLEHVFREHKISVNWKCFFFHNYERCVTENTLQRVQIISIIFQL